MLFFFFFFNDTATTEIYTLSLHDALPISCRDERHRDVRLLSCDRHFALRFVCRRCIFLGLPKWQGCYHPRSEEHTSELQSRRDLVCRLLLEKKKKKHKNNTNN